MNGDELLAADIRVAKLVDVGNIRTRYRSAYIFACRFVFQPSKRIIAEGRFPQHTATNPNPAVGTIMIMNGSSLPGTPAQHQHLYKVVAKNPVPPVIALFETKIGLQLLHRDLRILQPLVNLFEARNAA